MIPKGTSRAGLVGLATNLCFLNHLAAKSFCENQEMQMVSLLPCGRREWRWKLKAGNVDFGDDNLVTISGDCHHSTGRTMPGCRLSACNSFTCPNCRALYHVVKAEAGPETDSREIVCRACGRPLAGREGGFVLKYFLLQKADRTRGTSREGISKDAMSIDGTLKDGTLKQAGFVS